jgi:hypothetical protein
MSSKLDYLKRYLPSKKKTNALPVKKREAKQLQKMEDKGDFIAMREAKKEIERKQSSSS